MAWYPAAFTLATCALTPVAGKLAAVFPLDLVYSSFTFIFLVGSILCGWAPTSGAFIAGRAIAGVGAAGVASNGLTILVTIAPVTKRPLFMGFGGACFGIGLVIAPLLGGTWVSCASLSQILKFLLTSCQVHRSAHMAVVLLVTSSQVSSGPDPCLRQLSSQTNIPASRINIPFNLATLTVVSLFFHPKQRGGGSVVNRLKRLDLIGCLIFIPGIFMFLLALLTGGETGIWNSPTVIGLFVGSGVTLTLFALWERHQGDDAMIPGAVVLRRSIICTCLAAASQLAALTITSYYLPAWFQHVGSTTRPSSSPRSSSSLPQPSSPPCTPRPPPRTGSLFW